GAERHPARSNPQAHDRRNGRAARSNGTPAANGPRSRNSATGTANRGSAGRASEGRDREMVAADQSGQHQGRVNLTWISSSATHVLPIVHRTNSSILGSNKVASLPSSTRSLARPRFMTPRDASPVPG